MPNQLEQLRAMTTVVADTGDIEAIRRWQPVDATTNPSLLLRAVQQPEYAHYLDEALDQACAQTLGTDLRIQDAADRLAVLIGREIHALVPGRISTEVDSRLSFNTAATIERVHGLVDLYAREGIGTDRILIKIASTWEGIQAAERLEREGIQCNLTLLFSMAQARACAEAGVHLISPFVGRILDWYMAHEGTQYTASTDPGVQSVKRIYRYYKSRGYPTVVMGASFRNVGEIRELAGCDRLTIAPKLMAELDASDAPLPRRLEDDGSREERPYLMDEAGFRWALNEDAMASEKLAEGIRNFTQDQLKLEALLRERLDAR
ncbi:MAG: transaldolase [Gammaproteobacteria bacterium]